MDGNSESSMQQLIDYANKDVRRELLRSAYHAFKKDLCAMSEEYIRVNPTWYDNNGIWWSWNHTAKNWEMVDETHILNTLREEVFNGTDQTVSRARNILESLKQVSRSHEPQQLPNHWIQFADQLYDTTLEVSFPSTPQYFSTNTIPHKIGTSEDTPIIDSLFTSWIGNKAIDLYEILAYCLITNYPIHLAFCFVGSGRNGKSQFLKIQTRFLGQHNVSTSEFQMLASNRFETFSIYRKLAVQMGETNFEIMTNTALFKKLTGGDLIRYEAKHKNSFEEYSYSKIIIASNSLPSSKDTSEGFYRRWHIIEWNKEFNEGKDIIDTIPPIEYENLARKCVRILKELLERGKFSNQGSIIERREQYISASNPLSLWLLEHTEADAEHYERYGKVYNAYCKWLVSRKKRKVSMREFSEAIMDEGFEINKTWKAGESGTFIEGLRFKIATEIPSTQAIEVLRQSVNSALSDIKEHPENPCEVFEMKYHPSLIAIMVREKLIERKLDHYIIREQ